MFLSDYLAQTGIHQECLYNGTRIMVLSVKALKIEVKDSLLFFNMSLGALKESFGIPGDLDKGNFPVFFISEKNWNYKGKLPDLEYFGVDQLKPKAREKLISWHQSYQGEFVYAKEIVKYCMADTQLLMHALFRFREMVIDITKRYVPAVIKGKKTMEMAAIDPLRYITLASMCLAIFRLMFLPEHYSVEIEGHKEPFEGEFLNGKLKVKVDGVWRDGDNLEITNQTFVSTPIARLKSTGRQHHSKQAMEWLNYMSHKTGLAIQTARSKQGEFLLRHDGQKIYLDGYSKDPATGKEKAFQFHGKYLF